LQSSDFKLEKAAPVCYSRTMPLTLQDLYADPKFIAKVEKAIKAEIMSWTFETKNPDAVDPEASPIAVSLGPVKFSDEDEERIQGEVVTSARFTVTGEITIRFKVQTGKEVTETITEEFNGFMNFSLPWSWQARSLDFVIESVQVALNDLQLS
jgi:hypothetical protein